MQLLFWCRCFAVIVVVNSFRNEELLKELLKRIITDIKRIKDGRNINAKQKIVQRLFSNLCKRRINYVDGNRISRVLIQLRKNSCRCNCELKSFRDNLRRNKLPPHRIPIIRGGDSFSKRRRISKREYK